MRKPVFTADKKAVFAAWQESYATERAEKKAAQPGRNELLADIPDNVNSVAELRVVVADLQAAVRILAGYEK
jgi:hypothetical protein